MASTGRLNCPDEPFLSPDEPITQYKALRQLFARAILRNIFHKLPTSMGMPRGSITNRKMWNRAFQALIVYEYTTPNGRFLTEKGFQYIQDHEREFKPHA